MKTLTLKPLSKANEFSVTAVSRALSGFDEETRRQEARRQGYEPNLQARLLQAPTIGQIILTCGPRFSDPLFNEFADGVGSEASADFDDIPAAEHVHPRGQSAGAERRTTHSRVDCSRIERATPP
jgi:DNA-binding LacI/PurR family transcriptional regulator